MMRDSQPLFSLSCPSHPSLIIRFIRSWVKAGCSFGIPHNTLGKHLSLSLDPETYSESEQKEVIVIK